MENLMTRCWVSQNGGTRVDGASDAIDSSRCHCGIQRICYLWQETMLSRVHRSVHSEGMNVNVPLLFHKRTQVEDCILNYFLSSTRTEAYMNISNPLRLAQCNPETQTNISNLAPGFFRTVFRPEAHLDLFPETRFWRESWKRRWEHFRWLFYWLGKYKATNLGRREILVCPYISFLFAIMEESDAMEATGGGNTESTENTQDEEGSNAKKDAPDMSNGGTQTSPKQLTLLNIWGTRSPTTPSPSGSSTSSTPSSSTPSKRGRSSSTDSKASNRATFSNIDWWFEDEWRNTNKEENQISASFGYGVFILNVIFN